MHHREIKQPVMRNCLKYIKLAYELPIHTSKNRAWKVECNKQQLDVAPPMEWERKSTKLIMKPFLFIVIIFLFFRSCILILLILGD